MSADERHQRVRDAAAIAASVGFAPDVFDDALALSPAAADSYVWGFLTGTIDHPAIHPSTQKWLSYSAVPVGGDRYVAVLEEVVPRAEPGEEARLDLTPVIERVGHAYPSRRVAEQRARVFFARYVNRLAGNGVTLVPAPTFSAAAFTDEMYAFRAKVLAEIARRGAGS